MGRYFYRGEEVSTGRVTTGELDAPSKQAAEQLLGQKLRKLTHLSAVPKPKAKIEEATPGLDRGTRVGLVLLGLAGLTLVGGWARPAPPAAQELRSKIRVTGHLALSNGGQPGLVEARVHLPEIPRDEFKQLSPRGEGEFAIEFEVISARAPSHCSLLMNSPQGQLKVDHVPLIAASDGSLCCQLDRLRLTAPPAPQRAAPANRSFERTAPQRSPLPGH